LRKVTVFAGDGIGPEVVAATRAVLDAAGAGIEWEDVPVGDRGESSAGSRLPEAAFASAEATGLVLKGPTWTPFGVPFRIVRQDRVYPSIAIALRKELELTAAVRPIRSWPGVVTRYGDIDIIVFRENSEDLYLGRERMVDENTAEAVKIITRSATERIARFAAAYMQRIGRRRVTIGHKSNVLKLTDGLFLHAAQDALQAFPGVQADSRVIDALCMELVMKPQSFDCLLLSNLYGDIVSDLLAGLVGGLGIAPGANVGERCAMFEAVHGSAPDIAGKDVANPLSMILSAVMLLRYIEAGRVADRIEQAVGAVLRERRHVTRDLGGEAGTKRMTEAIVAALPR
jgi:isocitrate dehydrogenase (NAD+)